MALNDLTGQNIQDTYKKLVQTEGNTFADGSGSAITTFNVTSSHAISASYALSASHEITYELSSSHAETADALTPGIDINVRHVTSSGNISGSGNLDITGNANIDGNLDVDGTTNLDVVDIDGAVDMASTLVIASHITASGNIESVEKVMANKSFKHTQENPTMEEYPTIISKDELRGIVLGSTENATDHEITRFFGNNAGETAPNAYVTIGRGHITASGNISSSGTIVASKIKSLGSEVILENGHITASGEISSSGIITAKQVFAGDTDLSSAPAQVGVKDNDGNKIAIFSRKGSGTNAHVGRMVLRDNTNVKVELQAVGENKFHGGGMSISGSLNMTGSLSHITASGNISSSGDLFGENLTITSVTTTDRLIIDQIDEKNAGDGVRFMHNITASGEVSASKVIADTISSPTNITYTTDTDGDEVGQHIFRDRANVLATIDETGADFISHITASGNISASGNVYANQYWIQGEALAVITGGEFRLGGSTNLKTKIFGTNIELDAPVTASGNISSSVNIIANNIFADNAYRIKDSGGTSRHLITKYGNYISLGNTNFDGINLTGSLSSNGNITTTGALTGKSLVISDDIHITSHITASGNISASGAVSASGIYLPAQGRVYFADDQFITGQNNSITIDGDDTVKIKADNFVEFKDSSNNTSAYIDPNAGHITSSGNISASGGIIATGNIESDGIIIGDGLDINGTTTFNDGNITNVGGITLDSIFSDAGGDIAINFTSTDIDTRIDDTSVLKMSIDSADFFNDGVIGHISASGDISASGNITAGTINIESGTDAELGSGGYLIVGTVGSTNLAIDNNEILARNNGAESHLNIQHNGGDVRIHNGQAGTEFIINDSGHVTASGDISSSAGNITLNESITLGHATPNITTAGDLTISSNTTHLDSAGQINIDSDTGIIHFSDGGATKLTINSTKGDISASGNISASGTITAVSMSGDGSGLTNISATVPSGTVSGSGQINHDLTTNFVANKHIDHTDVTMTAGDGLIGGGAIEASRTFSVNSASLAPFFSSSLNDFTTAGNISASGNITSSGLYTIGNISSSGTITANEANIIGNITASGNIRAGREGFLGSYAAGGGEVQGVWSIGQTVGGGTCYKIDTSADNFGNHYGLGYAYNGNGGSVTGLGHQFVLVNNGTVGGALSFQGDASLRNITGSNISASGDVHCDNLVLGNRLDANQIGSNGNVGNTEYGRLDGITGNIQTQLNDISNVTSSYAVTGSDVLFNHITSSGNISASGTIEASSFKGTKLVLAHQSQIIVSPVADRYYYGNGSQGFFHHQHTGNLTGDSPIGLKLTQGGQHNAIILPCDIQDIELRASCRMNVNDTGFAFWIMKTPRADKVLSNSELEFVASASVDGSFIGAQDNRMHTCDITGSHTFVTNCSASEEEQLVILFQPHGSGTHSSANTKFYWTLSARTKE